MSAKLTDLLVLLHELETGRREVPEQVPELRIKPRTHTTSRGLDGKNYYALRQDRP